MSGIRLVKSFRGEAYEDERFGDASHRYSRGMVRVTRVSVLSQPLTEVIGTVVAVLILWIGAKEVLQTPPVMDGATLITFMILVMRLLPPLKQLSQAPTTAQQSFAAAERLFEVLDQPTEAQTDRGTAEVSGLERADRVCGCIVRVRPGTSPLPHQLYGAARGSGCAGWAEQRREEYPGGSHSAFL